MTREEAMNAFRELVRQYGLQWNASVPAVAYDKLNEVNRVLTTADRREALGLSN